MTIIADMGVFFVRETGLKVFLRLKRTFLETHTCPFCKGNLRFFGYKQRLYRDYINNRTLTYNIPRVQCSNSECHMKELRHNINGVTHLVLPENIVPYFQCDSELLGDVGIARTIKEDLKNLTDRIGIAICNSILEKLRIKYESRRPGLWQWIMDEFVVKPRGERYAKVWAMAVREFQSYRNFNLANSQDFYTHKELLRMPFSCVTSLGRILSQLTTENVPQISTYATWPASDFFIELNSTAPLWLSDEKIWRDTS